MKYHEDNEGERNARTYIDFPEEAALARLLVKLLPNEVRKRSVPSTRAKLPSPTRSDTCEEAGGGVKRAEAAPSIASAAL